MQVELIASELHYFEHMIPIHDALPDELKGPTHTIRPHVRPPAKGNIVMVAAWQDMVALPDDVKVIFVEHGAGQTYGGDPKSAWLPGYSGGANKRRGVILYICPSQHVADRFDGETAVVGCPKMDVWHGDLPERTGAPTAVFAWHWDARMVSPEARTAFWHYAPLLADIVHRWQAHGWQVAGHLHPRWRSSLYETMVGMGMAVAGHDSAVFDNADILFVDNSSLAYEFASLERPVVSLNAPWYRRNVEHGLRFWSNVPGPQVDSPEELLAWPNPDRWVIDNEPRLRVRAVDYAYAYTDGHAARRAADAIVERLGRM